MCLSDELYLYSIMPLPALSTNEPRAKHANRSFALRTLILAKHGCGRQPPRVYDCGAAVFIASSALFLLRLPHYFSHLGFRYIKSARAACPGRVAPQVRLELTTLRLTAECSAIELLRIIRGLWRDDSFACPGGLLVSFRYFYTWLWLTPRLRTALLPRARSASASPLASPGFRSLPRSSLCFGEREKLSFLPLLLDPGNFRTLPKPFPAQYHQRLEA